MKNNKKYIRRIERYKKLTERNTLKITNINTYDDFLDFLFITEGSRYYYPSHKEVYLPEMKAKVELKDLSEYTFLKFCHRAYKEGVVDIPYPEPLEKYLNDFSERESTSTELVTPNIITHVIFTIKGNGEMRRIFSNRERMQRDHKVAIVSMVVAVISAITAILALFINKG